MGKRSITGLLFAAAVVMAGTQLGSVEAQAKPHHGHGWDDNGDHHPAAGGAELRI